MTLEDKLSSLRNRWASYHDHKEQMAFGAATLYLGAATTVVFKAGDVLHTTAPRFLIVKLMIASVLLAFLFVGWQLRNRETAAGIVRACDCLLSGDLTDGAMEAGIWRDVPLPGVVTKKLDDLSRTGEFLAGPKTAAFITYTAMGVWTIGAIVALRHAA